eukprot:2311754-Rhodomonas_salina.1
MTEDDSWSRRLVQHRELRGHPHPLQPTPHASSSIRGAPSLPLATPSLPLALLTLLLPSTSGSESTTRSPGSRSL